MSTRSQETPFRRHVGRLTFQLLAASSGLLATLLLLGHTRWLSISNNGRIGVCRSKGVRLKPPLITRCTVNIGSRYFVKGRVGFEYSVVERLLVGVLPLDLDKGADDRDGKDELDLADHG